MSGRKGSRERAKNLESSLLPEATKSSSYIEGGQTIE